MAGPQIAKHLGIWLAAPTAIAVLCFWALVGVFDDNPFIAPNSLPPSNAGKDPLPAGDQTAATPGRTSEAELDRALAAAFRETATGAVRTRAVLSRYGVLMGVTAELPEPSRTFGRYVNLRFTIVPRDRGFDVKRMAVGRYEIPSGWIDEVFEFAMRKLDGADNVMAILSDIRAIDTAERTVTMAPGFAEPSPGSPAG